MKPSKTTLILMAIAAAITIFGLVTGWYLFILLVLPLGWLFNKKEK
ncbi:MAG TPA: hypothetical protein VFM65_03305 [Flavobacteriaceae bacterium]|nr:hypothetical protein [Flavobacteriaceae bacterium]